MAASTRGSLDVVAGDLVGNAAARAVHGWSAGADLVVTGPGPDDPLAAALAAFGLGDAVELEQSPAASGEVLRHLAAVAAECADRPLVVVDPATSLTLPALLDLLDRPHPGTAALVVDPDAVSAGRDAATPVRVGVDGAALESVGGAGHVATRPTHALGGVLRVDAADRAAAAATWARAAEQLSQQAGAVSEPDGLQRAVVAPGEQPDPAGPAPVERPQPGSAAFDLTVLALVREGVRVRASLLGPFTWQRGRARSEGAAGGPWRQRLRGASRGGDGWLSTTLIRPMSRRVTRVALRLGVTPNLVSLTSLLIGLVAAALILTDNRWAWVASAVLLQVALVVDCVDGEIARFTRRFSPFGAWLDGVGDRVKEYSVFAALAVVATWHGQSGWLVGLTAMAMVSLRHLEDYAYVDRLRPLRASRPVRLPLTEPSDGGPAGARTTLPEPPGSRAVAVHWLKKVIHVPIAERYLLISVTLLVFRPLLVLWVMIAATGFALVWTYGGRTVKAVLRRDGITDAARPAGRHWGHLDHQADLGPVARVAGRLAALPVPAGLVAAVVAVAGSAVLLGWRVQAGWTLLLAAVCVVVMGMAFRPPVHLRRGWSLGWQLSGWLWGAEAAVVASAAAALLPADARGSAYLWLAVVAYHRYDTVYRLRETGEGSAPWLTLFGLGTDGRILLVLAVATFAPQVLGPLLWIGALVLLVLYAVESGRAWRRRSVVARAALPSPAGAVAAGATGTEPRDGSAEDSGAEVVS